MYTVDSAQNHEDITNIRQTMKSAKGARQLTQPVHALT